MAVRIDYTYMRKQKRLHFFLRPFASIPIIIMLNLIGLSGILNPTSSLAKNTFELLNPDYSGTTTTISELPEHPEATLENTTKYAVIKTVPALIILPYLIFLSILVLDACVLFIVPTYISVPLDLFVLFKGQYPPWMYHYIINLITVSIRYKLYVFGISDTYPSFSNSDPNLQLQLPSWKIPSSRFLPIFRKILVAPSIIFFLCANALWLVIFLPVWLYIILSGTKPRWFHNYTILLTQWLIKIIFYAICYTNDEYPHAQNKNC